MEENVKTVEDGEKNNAIAKCFSKGSLKNITGMIMGTDVHDSDKVYALKKSSGRNLNTCVIGQTGSGKTEDYAIPYVIQAVRAGHSVIVHDPTLEAYCKTKQFIGSKGYEIKTISADELDIDIKGLGEKAFQPDNEYDDIYMAPGKKECAYFITPSGNRTAKDILTWSLIRLMLYADCTKNCCLDFKTDLILDDFCDMGFIEKIDSMLCVIRSRGICCHLIINSLEQLKKAYGEEEAYTLLNVCDTLVLTKTNDQSTAQLFSSQSGLNCKDVLNIGRWKSLIKFRTAPAIILDMVRYTDLLGAVAGKGR